MNDKGPSDSIMEREIKSCLRVLGIPFTVEQIKGLLAYIGEIEKWNTRFNLVKASGKTLLIRHLFDSLAGLSAFLNTVNRRIILDIGSGAGFPGIPLSVFLPGSHFILSERSRVKAGFLSNIIILLGLRNAEVFDDDFRKLEKKTDIITFRAFSGFDRVLDDCLKLLDHGGRIIAYKGRLQKIDEELSVIDTTRVNIEINRLAVPLLDEERHLVILKMIS